MDLSFLKETGIQLIIAMTIIIVVLATIYATTKGYTIEFWPPKLISPTNQTKKTDSKEIFTFLERQDVDKAIGTVEERFRQAKLEIFISGNDNKYIAESCSALIDEALAKGVRIKILCTDPNSSAAAMLPFIDPRFKNEDDFRLSMTTVIRELEGRRNRHPQLFEYRLLPFLPSISFFMVDPSLTSGIIKSEIYTAKPYQSRPHFVISSDSKWRPYFISQWHNYWNAGTVNGSNRHSLEPQ